ncbi:acetylornithine deacetylase/succinyldiaminopimelate desuccinylase-like deacylase [Frankia sp. EI5c]|uniref:M20/M25/M40 family metallo-hydrolase n=1 Tax=Frankia sp. EI5c TaxID=683316 RepID=UPI0007C2A9DD|nr:M20/M25/M40 family metallo-hydrolase [Frankia sp. EI5c]OAA25363.1 acetylornithine deacetylase/succinyldiaminopimelate desuccinylase-like deacylase [Frankia sp. EI5c]
MSTGADRLAAAAERVLARTEELCRIPAPPFGEAGRAAVVAGWWAADGLAEVRVDATGNVWAKVRDGVGAASGAVVVAAHLDTVFGPEVEHGVRREGDRLVGPGVGDDSVAVAALAELGWLLAAGDSATAGTGTGTDTGTGGTGTGAGGRAVWVLATVGEEGVGNLAGVTAALAAPPVPVAALIAVEGNYLGRVTTTGVGSVRFAVTVTGPGGHAWERADAPSAVHAAAGLVARLAALARPADPAHPAAVPGRVAVNVGRISGGEAINIRAAGCRFEVDLRADSAAGLGALERGARAVIDDPGTGLSVEVREIGRRPAGGIAADHPLATAAFAALARRGLAGREHAASTDANAAYAAGIPAITVGITYGEREHTVDEWIDLAPVADGLAALADTAASAARLFEE